MLRENAVRVIDVFKEWDEDGDGLVSKREFRRAIAALGYEASCAVTQHEYTMPQHAITALV